MILACIPQLELVSLPHETEEGTNVDTDKGTDESIDVDTDVGTDVGTDEGTDVGTDGRAPLKVHTSGRYSHATPRF